MVISCTYRESVFGSPPEDWVSSGRVSTSTTTGLSSPSSGPVGPSTTTSTTWDVGMVSGGREPRLALRGSRVFLPSAGDTGGGGPVYTIVGVSRSVTTKIPQNEKVLYLPRGDV